MKVLTVGSLILVLYGLWKNGTWSRLAGQTFMPLLNDLYEKLLLQSYSIEKVKVSLQSVSFVWRLRYQNDLPKRLTLKDPVFHIWGLSEGVDLDSDIGVGTHLKYFTAHLDSLEVAANSVGFIPIKVVFPLLDVATKFASYPKLIGQLKTEAMGMPFAFKMPLDLDVVQLIKKTIGL